MIGANSISLSTASPPILAHLSDKYPDQPEPAGEADPESIPEEVEKSVVVAVASTSAHGLLLSIGVLSDELHPEYPDLPKIINRIPNMIRNTVQKL